MQAIPHEYWSIGRGSLHIFTVHQHHPKRTRKRIPTTRYYANTHLWRAVEVKAVRGGTTGAKAEAVATRTERTAAVNFMVSFSCVCLVVLLVDETVEDALPVLLHFSTTIDGWHFHFQQTRKGERTSDWNTPGPRILGRPNPLDGQTPSTFPSTQFGVSPA